MTPPRAPIVAPATVALEIATTGVETVVIAVVLAITAHRVILLSSSSRRSILLTRSGVGLCPHGPCLRAHILRLSGLVPLLPVRSQAFWVSVLRLTLPLLHHPPLTLQLLCTLCLSLLQTALGTWTRVPHPT